jgi:drug/metabolite transporter (DMT)-like permease
VHDQQYGAATQSIITLLLLAFVVFRFAVRELRPRVIRAGWRLWLRPAILIALTIYVCGIAVVIDPGGIGELVVALPIGALVGLIAGIFIVRYTAFSPAPVPRAVTASGSWLTFGIWIVVFVLRLAARYVVPHGASARAQLPMDGATVAVGAVAFVVIAIAFQAAIGRYTRLAATADPLVAAGGSTAVAND